ncbi:DUF1439 domain-containing protein [Gallaecimonas sp. GXIMD4217]|uniref:DUF1439 domain-containing protein n=1 Tax=Gallaecimonas sp. GXIMD4217 TaxID=3131927 RepID=UPI00311B394E
MKKLLFLAAALFLGGCAQLAQFSQYAVTDAMVESALADKLDELNARYAAKSKVSLHLNEMDVTIGPDGQDVVRLSVAGGARVDAWLARLPVNLKLSLQARPVYEPAEQAIYLKELRLLDSSAEALGYKGNLQPLSDELMQLVHQVLDNRPVYKLDPNDPRQALIGQVPIRMTVQQGRLLFQPQL